MRTCADCLVEIRPQSTRCRKCAGLLRRKPREKGNGYLRVFTPGHPMAGRDGYALAHRVVLFDAGVEIPAGWHVHHRNGDKSDNSLENLEAIDPSEHSNLHNGCDGQVRGFAAGRAVAARNRREKTHCPHGHAYDAENTRVYQGRRFCTTCARERDRQRRRSLRDLTHLSEQIEGGYR